MRTGCDHGEVGRLLAAVVYARRVFEDVGFEISGDRDVTRLVGYATNETEQLMPAGINTERVVTLQVAACLRRVGTLAMHNKSAVDCVDVRCGQTLRLTYYEYCGNGLGTAPESLVDYPVDGICLGDELRTELLMLQAVDDGRVKGMEKSFGFATPGLPRTKREWDRHNERLFELVVLTVHRLRTLERILYMNLLKHRGYHFSHAGVAFAPQHERRAKRRRLSCDSSTPPSIATV